MSIADNQTNASSPMSVTERRSAARILQFKERLQEKTGAVGEWARLRADDAHHVMERRPLATAGVSAAAAFVGGLALGLLLAGRIESMRRTSVPDRMFSRFVGRSKSRLGM